MSNVIPELTSGEEKKEHAVPTTPEQVAPARQPSVLIPFCMGSCSGISSLIMILCCVLMTILVVFVRRSPEPLSTTYTPNAIDAARYETKMAIAAQDAQSESTFSLEYSQEEFGSWLHRNYDTLSSNEVLDLSVISDIGEFRARSSFNDWFFQTRFANSKVYIYGETSILQRVLILGMLIEAEIKPSQLRSDQGDPLTVNILSVQIGNVLIKNPNRNKEEIEFIYNIERDLEDVLIGMLRINQPYRINQVTFAGTNIVINGFVDTTPPTPVPVTPTRRPTITRTPTVPVTPTERATLAPTPEQFIPSTEGASEEATEAVSEVTTETPAENATPSPTTTP